MSSDLIQRLQRLQRGFSWPCASEADAEALLADAAALYRLTDHNELSEPAAVSSALMDLVDQFGPLNRALLSAAGFDAARATQLNAACVAINGCTHLASRLQLPQNGMFRLASALSLVFGAGTAYLQQRTADPDDTPRHFAALLPECNYQLAVASSVFQRAANPKQHPDTAAALVRTAARPQALLPWLLVVSEALLALPLQTASATGSSTACCQERLTAALTSYVVTVRALLGYLPDVYHDAMQQAPATQQAVLSVLLDRCLPLLASDCSPETLGSNNHPHYALACCLPLALTSPCLVSQLAQRMGQPQAAACLQQALQVVAALPLQHSPAAPAGDFGEQHAVLMLLLGQLFEDFHRGAGSAAASQLFQEALPGMVAMLAALAAEGSVPAPRLARICCGLRQAATVILQHRLGIGSDGQLAAWAAACSAALRLAPTLLQLHERCQQVDNEAWREGPSQLAHHLLWLLTGAQPAAAYVRQKFSAVPPPPPDEQAARQLWALHTSLCRLVAWLAADTSGALAALLPGGRMPNAAWLMNQTIGVRYALLVQGDLCIRNGVLSADFLRGVCAAHWAALQGSVQALGGLSRCSDLLPMVVGDLHAMCDAYGKLLIDALLASMFGEAIVRLAPTLHEFPDYGQLVVEAAGSFPLLAAALASSGGLQSLLETAQRQRRSGDSDKAVGLVAIVINALHTLDAAVNVATAVSAAATPQQQPLLQHLQQAAGVSAGLPCGGEASSANPLGQRVLAQLPDLSSRLPAAGELADLLQQWQPAAQPERHANVRLELAQAAATRTCAYLRCANLGGEGGPAAGQGVGSMRCSGCRAVWYCGTACSHADWRAGHKRMCKPLGAARRAAKAAAKAAAAATEPEQQGS